MEGTLDLFAVQVVLIVASGVALWAARQRPWLAAVTVATLTLAALLPLLTELVLDASQNVTVSISTDVEKKQHKVWVKGKMEPNLPGTILAARLDQALGGKTTSRLRRLAPDSTGAFKVAFPRPTAGRCTVIVRYPGDRYHLMTRAVEAFRCHRAEPNEKGTG